MPLKGSNGSVQTCFVVLAVLLFISSVQGGIITTARRRSLLNTAGTGARSAFVAIDPTQLGCGDLQQLLHDTLVTANFSAGNTDLPTAHAARLLEVDSLTAYLQSLTDADRVAPYAWSSLTPARDILANVTALSFCPLQGGYTVQYQVRFTSCLAYAVVHAQVRLLTSPGCNWKSLEIVGGACNAEITSSLVVPLDATTVSNACGLEVARLL